MSDPFAPPPDELARLENEISQTLLELRGARAIYEHGPTEHNRQVVDCTEWRLNQLLARHPRQAEMPAPQPMNAG